MILLSLKEFFRLIPSLLSLCLHPLSIPPPSLPVSDSTDIPRASFSTSPGLWLSLNSLRLRRVWPPTEDVFKPALTLMKCLRYSPGAAVAHTVVRVLTDTTALCVCLCVRDRSRFLKSQTTNRGSFDEWKLWISSNHLEKTAFPWRPNAVW